ncbi:MAG: GDSL-type esterase/lipase family protein [Planctomycetes bacterium]|nr:GDSL-type esterase/lipase family protein [Planctomycetota bacterium]
MTARARTARRGSARLAAVAFGLVLAALIGYFGWRAWQRSAADVAPIELRESAPVSAEKLSARRAALADPTRAWTRTTRRFELTAEDAREISPLDAPNQQYDPICFLKHDPNLDLNVDWPEHPKGRWNLRTNSLGLREDRELAPQFDGLRVLCTGDSHTDGVCNNWESWPHRLEAALRKAHPTAAVEAINAGKGSYSFYHYRGVLERLATLEPDLFVVAVYGGNDFMEVTRPWYFFAGAERPRFDLEDWQRLKAARSTDAPGIAQFWTSALYFRRFPDEVDVAVSAALALSADIAGAAGARGIRVLFVYVPSRAELAPDAEVERSRATLTALGLTRADLDTSGRIADRYLQGLAALDVPTVDLRARFRAEPRAPYWDRDQHIDLAGQAAIAAELVPWLEPLLVAR